MESAAIDDASTEQELLAQPAAGGLCLNLVQSQPFKWQIDAES